MKQTALIKNSVKLASCIHQKQCLQLERACTWLGSQTCLVYTIGVENYTKKEKKPLHLHYSKIIVLLSFCVILTRVRMTQ